MLKLLEANDACSACLRLNFFGASVSFENYAFILLFLAEEPFYYTPLLKIRVSTPKNSTILV
jgi:hypothetical protein